MRGGDEELSRAKIVVVIQLRYQTHSLSSALIIGPFISRSSSSVAIVVTIGRGKLVMGCMEGSCESSCCSLICLPRWVDPFHLRMVEAIYGMQHTTGRGILGPKTFSSLPPKLLWTSRSSRYWLTIHGLRTTPEDFH